MLELTIAAFGRDQVRNRQGRVLQSSISLKLTSPRSKRKPRNQALKTSRYCASSKAFKYETDSTSNCKETSAAKKLNYTQLAS